MNIDEFIIQYGNKSNSILDRKYRNYISNQMSELDEEGLDRWEVYNMVIGELIDLGRDSDFEEIKYRLTDGEMVSYVFNDVLDRVVDCSMLLRLMKKKVYLFADADRYAKYF